MRGTCSAGFALAGTGEPEQVLPVPYQDIHMRSMMPIAHLTWSAVWTGVASGAVERARAFIRNVRRSGAPLPPGAAHLTRATASLQTLRALVASSLQRFESIAEQPEELDALAFQTAMNLLKVNASETALATVMSAMQACGLAGYRNDGAFSISRALRDILSAPIMINNDRILANAAGAPSADGSAGDATRLNSSEVTDALTVASPRRCPLPASEDRLDVLGRSLFAETGSPGVHGRTALFETVIDGLTALITRLREPGTEVLRFPPVMTRGHVEKAGYLGSFPHLLGCVCGLVGDDREIHAALAPLQRRPRLDRRAAGERSRAHARRPAIRSIRSPPRAARSRRPDTGSTSRPIASAARRPTRSIASRRSACANSCAWARPTRRPISATAGWRARRRLRRASRCRTASRRRATRSSGARRS